MRVLVTWGSKHGGTAGIGHIVGHELEMRGIEVVTASVDEVTRLDGFDAVIIGGALYANRWPAGVRRFVNRHLAELRKVPVWLFSSGPLDDSAERNDLPPPTQVAVLAERVGASGHVTFGGRLEPDVKGFPAQAMAKTMAGDWRNPERIRAWAVDLASALPAARPGTPIDHPARALRHALAPAVVGWALCAATLAGLLHLGMSMTGARVIHTIAASMFFVALAWHYFRARGAREPLPTAVAWTAVVVLLDLIVTGDVPESLAMLQSITGLWLPLALIFLATWLTGLLRSTMPWPKTKPARRDQPPPTDRGARLSATRAGT